MKIDGINQPRQDFQEKNRIKAVPHTPFGDDRVSLGHAAGSEKSGSIDIGKLFRKSKAVWEYRWLRKPARKGIFSASDDSVYTGDYNTVYKLDGKTGNVAWKKRFDKELDSWPAKEGKSGTIYVCTADSYLRALDPADGSEKWEFNMKVRGGEAVVSKNGNLYFQYKDDLVVLKPDGHKHFRFRINDYMQRAPLLDDDGNAYVATDERGIYAISSDGKKLWHVQGKSVDYFPSDPDKIYTTSDKTIVARDKKSGEKIWEKELPEFNVAVADKNRAFIQKYKEIKCLDSKTGKTLWGKKFDSDSRAKLLIENDTLIMGGEEGLKALDAKTGSLRYEINTGGDCRWMNTSRTEDGVLIFNSNREVYMIDPQKGKVIDRFAPTHGVSSFQVNKKDGMLYVEEDETFNILAFNIANYKQQAKEMFDKKEIPEKIPAKIEMGDEYVEIGGVRLKKHKWEDRG